MTKFVIYERLYPGSYACTVYLREYDIEKKDMYKPIKSAKKKLGELYGGFYFKKMMT